MKALIIAANGQQDVEFSYPFYRLQEAGFDVFVKTPEMQSCTGIAGTKIKAGWHDEYPHQGELMYEYSYPIAQFGAFDLLILPGGVKAMEILRLQADLLEFIRWHHEQGKVIAAICSGVQLLISAGIVRGKNMCIYPAHRVDLENAGATFIDAPVVAAGPPGGMIISSPHYRHLGAWMARVLLATLMSVETENA